MKQSQMLIPTLKETPKGAEALSHQMLVRAGTFARFLPACTLIYHWHIGF